MSTQPEINAQNGQTQDVASHRWLDLTALWRPARPKEAAHPYINTATKDLVDRVKWSLRWGGEDLEKNEAAQLAWAELDKLCQVTPAIVPHLLKRCDTAQPTLGFRKKEFELLVASLVFRSSSTYSTIPQLVASLSAVGDYRAAAIVSSNAREETGDKDHIPHANLLFHSTAVVANALRCHHLTHESYHLMRVIAELRTSFGSQDFGTRSEDKEVLRDYVKSYSLAFPGNAYHCSSFSDDDYENAAYFFSLVTPEMFSYHDTALQMNAPVGGHNGAELAARVLDFAVREASSVDEPKQGKFSYIGAWGEVVEAFIGHIDKHSLTTFIPELKHDTFVALNLVRSGWVNGEDQLGYKYGKRRLRNFARAWSRAHNDDNLGKRLGWSANAESGHADDALMVAEEYLHRLSPSAFVYALKSATSMIKSRLDFWQQVASKMEQLADLDSEDNPKILPKR